MQNTGNYMRNAEKTESKTFLSTRRRKQKFEKITRLTISRCDVSKIVRLSIYKVHVLVATDTQQMEGKGRGEEKQKMIGNQNLLHDSTNETTTTTTTTWRRTEKHDHQQNKATTI
jgi:hypothetical protein